MSELKEFTAEEMRGCPKFDINEDRNFEYVDFYSGELKIKHIDLGMTRITNRMKCNPIDRMNAICKGLFDLMPHVDAIRTSYIIDYNY